MTREQVAAMLEDVGQALSGGDARAAARCWTVPALVLHDDTALLVTTIDEIEAFFTRSVAWYNERAIVATRPEVGEFTSLGEAIASVSVRWPGFDESGAEVSSERSFYIVQVDGQGSPRIRVALSLP